MSLFATLDADVMHEMGCKEIAVGDTISILGKKYDVVQNVYYVFKGKSETFAKGSHDLWTEESGIGGTFANYLLVYVDDHQPDRFQR